MANIITTLFKFREDGTGLKKIKTDIDAANTTTGKFQAGWAGAMDTVKANAGTAAIAIGTTLVAAGAKAVAQFQDMALSAGQFADATGLAVQEASRWTAVADDIGISSDEVAAAVAKLNKEIGEGGGAVEKYGLELKRTRDGQADVNATMLEAIDVLNGIEDPTERARVAQELFGRSYANIAELIFQDASKVKEALDGVSEAQIIDEEELEKAREFRAAMDELQDSLLDISLVVGEEIVPVLSDAAGAITDIKTAVDNLPDLPDLPGWADQSVDAFGKMTNPTKWFTEPVRLFNEIQQGGEAVADELNNRTVPAMGAAGRAARDMGEEASDALDEATESTRNWRDLITDPAIRDALAGGASAASEFAFEVDELADAATRYVDAFDPVLKGLNDLKTKVEKERTLIKLAEQFNEIKAGEGDREDVLNLIDDVLRLGETYDDLPDEKITKIGVLLDQGDINQAILELQRLVGGWSVNLGIGPTRFRINDEGRSAPTPINSVNVGPAGGTTIINNYPVTPTPAQVTNLDADFLFANGQRLR